MGFEQVEDVRKRMAGCVRCPRLRERMAILDRPSGAALGRGSSTAPILVVGSGPGEADLVRTTPHASPWRGAAGQRLIQMLAHAAYAAKLVSPDLKTAFENRPQRGGTHEELRDYWESLWDVFEDRFFFTNATHCLPPHGELPTPTEVTHCRSWLAELVYAVDPLLIMAVGNIAATALLGAKPDLTVALEPGKLYTIAIPSQGRPGERIPYAMQVLPSIGVLMHAKDQALMAKNTGQHALWRDRAAWGMAQVDRTLKLAYGEGFWEYTRKDRRPL